MPYHQLKIFAPIDRVEEALPLIQAGADEFFCGVLIENKDLASIRQWGTERSNLPDLDSLEKLTAIVKKNQKKIFLALNQMSVKPLTLHLISKYVEKFKKIGIDGLIVGNIELLHHLKNCGLKIIASSVLETKNKETAEFLIKEFGVERIILDRQITLADIKSIISKFPEIEFEAFVMNSGCRSLASACRYLFVGKKRYQYEQTTLSPYLPPNSLSHLCCSFFSVTDKNKTNFLSSKDKEIITHRLSMPQPTCGACALFHFKKYGIASVKIVGRGQPLEAKIMSIKVVRKALNLLEASFSREDFYFKVQKLFKKTYGKKCNRACCYYPHFFNS